MLGAQLVDEVGVLRAVVGLDPRRQRTRVAGRGQETPCEGDGDEPRQGQDEEGEELPLLVVRIFGAAHGVGMQPGAGAQRGTGFGVQTRFFVRAEGGRESRKEGGCRGKKSGRSVCPDARGSAWRALEIVASNYFSRGALFGGPAYICTHPISLAYACAAPDVVLFKIALPLSILHFDNDDYGNYGGQAPQTPRVSLRS